MNDTGYRKSLSGGLSGLGSTSTSALANLASTSNAQARNPEADSFAYIETLLESLAILGKLGTGLDLVAQKLPGEIFSLVEATVEEVSERAEYGRRSSVIGMVDSVNATSGRSTDLAFLSSPAIAAGALGIAGVAVAAALQVSTVHARRAVMDATALRLTALESSTKILDQEILKDFFWTLYSKLIAVSEGLRVVYEVANRIGSVRVPIQHLLHSGLLILSLCSGGTTRIRLVPSLVHCFPLRRSGHLYKPRWAVCGRFSGFPLMGPQVRTLLSDYITDEEQGAISGRNPISSINEILREGRFNRDKGKVCQVITRRQTRLSNVFY